MNKSTKTVFVVILSTILVGAVAFLITWGVINFDRIEMALSGTALYTKEDVEAAYQDGYNTAFMDRADYLKRIEDLKTDKETAISERNAYKVQYEEYYALYGAESKEVKRLSVLIQEKDASILAYENQIEKLNKSIETIEAFKEELAQSDKVLATFMYDGYIYELQYYDVGATVSIESPADTEDILFNGWTVDGETVDLTSYVISEHTTFVADLTHYYTVTFNVDGEVYDSQKVLDGDSITLPSAPVKDGYEFAGWSTDGATVIDVPTDNVSASATYIAVFEFVAQPFTGLEFICETDLNFASCSTWSDGQNYYVTKSTSPRVNYLFDKSSMSLINCSLPANSPEFFSGSKVINYKNITFYLDSSQGMYTLNKEAFAWEELSWDIVIDISYCWTDGNNLYFNRANGASYILNEKTMTLEEKKWNGLTTFNGYNVWTDGTNIYYSQDDEQYVLNKNSSTWEVKTWSGLSSFSGSSVWTDGYYVYYSNGSSHYQLNKENATWDAKSWSGNVNNFSLCKIRTDGENYYLLKSHEVYKFI